MKRLILAAALAFTASGALAAQPPTWRPVEALIKGKLLACTTPDSAIALIGRKRSDPWPEGCGLLKGSARVVVTPLAVTEVRFQD